MRARLVTKLDDVRRKIELLRKLEKDLASGVRRCDEQIQKGSHSECPVLDGLDAGG